MHLSLVNIQYYLSRYVLYGTAVVTAISVFERFVQETQDWAKENYPESAWADRLGRVDYNLRAANDLLNRFLALNVRDMIVKPRPNRRAADQERKQPNA